MISNLAVNQFVITSPKGTYFQSYKSVIAFIPYKGKTQLGQDYKYSQTTSKYRNIFLEETTKQTDAKIKSGEYKLVKEIKIKWNVYQ